VRPVRLLLVNPANGPSFWGFDYACDLLGRSYSNAPLALITVAALCPPSWEVKIVDENVEALDLDEPCDLVGLTAMNIQASRAFALADAFRRRGRTVLLGGPFATLQPERCTAHADVLFVGEAERTLPRFCRDYEEGRAAARYEEKEAIDPALSPIPRYDLLRRGAYASLPIQASRGCPFSCEFCDVIAMQGRRPRTKPVEQVLAEVEAAHRAGADSLFFTDDNFIGNLKHTRELLEGLARHRQETGIAPLLFTQSSVNLADHPELVSLAVKAGFLRLFLGIETPRRASLRETGKRQNLHGDLLSRIEVLQRAGIMIWAGMIVGFDHDDVSVFEEQARFLDQAGIAISMVGMLNAPPTTPLFARLSAEGRIAASVDWTDNCASSNIVPKSMSRAELLEGYAWLITELYKPENYARRVLTGIERMGAASPESGHRRFISYSQFQDLLRALRAFSLTSDSTRRRFFLPNLLKVAAKTPSRFAEAASHLGMWRHFETYVPQLVAQVQAAGARERVRARERLFARSTVAPSEAQEAWIGPPAPLLLDAAPA
jgi:radical SAM superfamily enzyme YgiQ (UPF0313 family)